MQEKVEAAGIAVEVPLSALKVVKERLNLCKLPSTTDDCLQVVSSYLDYILNVPRVSRIYSLLGYLRVEYSCLEDGSSCPTDKQTPNKQT